jgi:MYXO-CTERM domain-containing protein
MARDLRATVRGAALAAALGLGLPGAAAAATISEGALARGGITANLMGAIPCGTTGAVETAVGRFSGGGPAGSGGSVCGDARRVQVKTPNSPAPFGRYDPDGGRWLDSNDLEEVVWDVDVGRAIRGLSFGLTDAHDQPDSRFSFAVEGARWSIAEQEANGTLHLIRVMFDAPVDRTQVVFSTRGNDGFGIVSPTVQPVPLPPAALLALSGLGALALARRRRRGR